MAEEENAAYFRKREQQELKQSDNATDPQIKRLHWEMAQRYAFLASELEAKI